MLGKGISVWILMKFLFYMAITISPLAFPLATLLTGIMIFGGLGEHFELAAIKSAGIPLTRFMLPLAIFSFFISIVSFTLNNYITPIVNLRTYSLMYDIRKYNPAMEFQDGIFYNGINDYSIRVGSKSNDGQTLYDVLIYDHTNVRGNKKVIKADSGVIYSAPDNKSMIFELRDGWSYDESQERPDSQQTRMQFETWNIVFDLSNMGFQRTKEELFSNNERMKTAEELYTFTDSVKTKERQDLQNAQRSLGKYLSILDTNFSQKITTITPSNQANYEGSYWNSLPDSTKYQILSLAEGNIRSSKNLFFISVYDNGYNEERIRKHDIQFHMKFSYALACTVLFLIGAPLGGIIRKGGLGMPLVIGIVFFVIYFILGTTGQKLASQGKVPVWFGIWLSTIVLTPIAAVIIHQASTDSRLISKETYARIGRKIKQVFTKDKAT